MSSTNTTEEEKEGFHAGVEWGKGMRAGVVSLMSSLEEKSSPSIELRRDIRVSNVHSIVRIHSLVD